MVYLKQGNTGRSINHAIVSNRAFIIEAFLKGKPCTVRPAPQDVRFENSDDTDTVVQPDLTIWCKKSEESVKKDFLKVVVEILSPSTMEYDLSEKRDLYERKGIPEYWVVSLEKRRFMKYILANGKYERTAIHSGAFTSALFPELTFGVEEFFANVDERA